MTKTPFDAPFPEADIAPIVDYLTKTYGAERAMGQLRGAAGQGGRLG